MDIGLSSACFYPLETEKSFKKACETGASTVEIFMNADSEFEQDYLKEIKAVQEYYGVHVPSVHTMASFTESYYLFSSYTRRYIEARDTMFKRHFDVLHALRANILVLHGIKKPGSIPDEEYFERFAYLTEMGRREGIRVAQENVVHYRSESPLFLEHMARYIGDDFNMVFDIKQSLRTGVNPFEFIDRMHRYIRHIHISDHSETRDCIVPCTDGVFDFQRFFDRMKSYGYQGDYIIELYENGFENCEQLTHAMNQLKKML